MTEPSSSESDSTIAYVSDDMYDSENEVGGVEIRSKKVPLPRTTSDLDFPKKKRKVGYVRTLRRRADGNCTCNRCFWHSCFETDKFNIK